jgi:signal transduction histidine kinase/DNA-binding response OmpR family regulator
MNKEIRRILIVDDNESIHEDIKNILTSGHAIEDIVRDALSKELFDSPDNRIDAMRDVAFTYAIDSAYQGEEAVKMADDAGRKGAPYALIFMDVRMPPGIDGIQAVKRIWKTYPQTEVVLCTAFSDYAWDEIMVQLGFSDHLLFIRKPVDSVAVKQMALTLTTKWELEWKSRGYIQSLAESRALYKSLVNNLGLGIMLIDRGMTILMVNSQMKQWNPALSGEGKQKCYQLIPNHLHDQPCRTCPACMTFEDGLTHEYIADMMVGEEVRKQRVQVFPVLDASGKTVNAIVVVEDITERTRLEERISSAQKMEFLGSIASGVAHDLNNILTGIVALPDLLLLETPPQSPSIEYLHMIKESANRASAIIEDLLTLSRRSVAAHEVVDLNTIISAGLASPEFKLTHSDHPAVSVESSLAPCLRNMRGSKVHLSKAVINLLMNAMEAIPRSGSIEITTDNITHDGTASADPTAPSGEFVRLRIDDNGIGIPREIQRKIFEPFYTTKVMGRRSGTGLGLAIVERTVQDHNGHLHIDSTVGRGTTFTLEFPATRDELINEKKPLILPEIVRGNGQSILVVEDSHELHAVPGFILGKLGYRVHVVESGENAAAYLEKNIVDLVILDMVFDCGMDGLEALKHILAVRPGQPTILTCGFSRTERITAAQQLGAGRFIPKPYDLAYFASAIKEELERSNTPVGRASQPTRGKSSPAPDGGTP